MRGPRELRGGTAGSTLLREYDGVPFASVAECHCDFPGHPADLLRGCSAHPHQFSTQQNGIRTDGEMEVAEPTLVGRNGKRR